jgi:uncharacterized membrane protein
MYLGVPLDPIGALVFLVVLILVIWLIVTLIRKL